MALGAGNSIVNSLMHSITQITMTPFNTTATKVPAGPASFNAWAVGENMPPITAETVMNWLSLDSCDTKRTASYKDLPALQVLSAKQLGLTKSCEVFANLPQMNLVCHFERCFRS